MVPTIVSKDDTNESFAQDNKRNHKSTAETHFPAGTQHTIDSTPSPTRPISIKRQIYYQPVAG